MSPVKRCGHNLSLAARGGALRVDCAREETGPEDVGQQVLMRGSTPHVRLYVRGCLCLGTGIDVAIGHTTYPRAPLNLGSVPSVAR